jgi:ABC-type polysaccharide/polyol phosphate export permease
MAEISMAEISMAEISMAESTAGGHVDAGPPRRDVLLATKLHVPRAQPGLAIGIIAAAAFAAAWLAVALGLAAKTPESAGLAVVPLILLPFLSSAVVPAAKMGQGVRQFAEYQPFTPIIESLRGLLAGPPSAGYAAAALAWSAGIALLGYRWSRATFSRRA